MGKLPSKYVVLTKKLNNIMYELIVKTNSDMVYVGKEETLTEKLCAFSKVLTTNSRDIRDIRELYNEIIDGSEESFNSFKEVWDYVNINGNPESELIKLIKAKQDAEEGKGLSQNDLTDLLYEKLVNDYSAEDLDKKFRIIVGSVKDIRMEVRELKKRNNAYIGASVPKEVKHGDVWYQIVSVDPEDGHYTLDSQQSINNDGNDDNDELLNSVIDNNNSSGLQY